MKRVADLLIHASCVAIAGRAILISGQSGSGKSDLSLRLIDRGADLVSDDYTQLREAGGTLLASPPERISGRIEARGVGILSMPCITDVAVGLLIDLDGAPERLPLPSARELLGVQLPTIALHALEPSAPIKVEAALQLHGLPFPCPL